MATSALLSSPTVRIQSRRNTAQRPVVLVNSCRPRYGGMRSPFFQMQGLPFMGNAQAWAGSPADSQKAWQDMMKMAEQAFGPESTRSWQRAAESAANACAFPVDIEESETEYVLTADVPGLSKGDLKIRIKEESRELTVSGERRQGAAAGQAAAASSEAAEGKAEAAQAEGFQGRRTFERRMGRFERTFTLSEKADPNAIKAKVERGVLTLTIQKRQRDEPQVKDVPIWD